MVDAVLGDGVGVGERAGWGDHIFDSLDDNFTIGSIDYYDEAAGLPYPAIWGLRASYGIRRTEAMTVADTSVGKPRWGYVAQDALALTDPPLPVLRYRTTVGDRIVISPLLRVALRAVLTQAMTVGEAVRVSRGLLVLERLRLTETAQITARYASALVQALTVNDALGRFFGAEVADTITVAQTQASVYRGHAGTADTMTLADALGQTLVFKVSMPEGVELSDTQAIKMLFQPTVADGVLFDAVYVSPNGSITTWAVNSRTNAVTEYTGYEFTSFARAGLRYLASSDDGLYVLDGATDDTADIIADIKTGLAQFAGSRFSAIKALYLGIRATGEFALKVIDGAGTERTYKVLVDGRRTAKVQIGKGIRTRYMAFELISTGQDFDLDTIEIVPLLETRRV